MVFFGGLEGIDGIIEQDERTKLNNEEIKNSFNFLVKPLAEQGTRTIRTEESLLVTLASLYPKLRLS